MRKGGFRLRGVHCCPRPPSWLSAGPVLLITWCGPYSRQSSQLPIWSGNLHRMRMDPKARFNNSVPERILQHRRGLILDSSGRLDLPDDARQMEGTIGSRMCNLFLTSPKNHGISLCGSYSKSYGSTICPSGGSRRPAVDGITGARPPECAALWR